MSVVQQGAPSTAVQGLGAWLARIAPRSARGALTVAIVSDGQIRALNKRFRRVDKVTDVLSFPSDLPVHLGDIAIARGMATRQARRLGHSVKAELRVLALHGLLHLLGYDHERDAGRMARAEARLRKRAGLPLGLIARSS